jgi:hypothetical protein
MLLAGLIGGILAAVLTLTVLSALGEQGPRFAEWNTQRFITRFEWAALQSELEYYRAFTPMDEHGLGPPEIGLYVEDEPCRPPGKDKTPCVYFHVNPATFRSLSTQKLMNGFKMAAMFMSSTVARRFNEEHMRTIAEKDIKVLFLDAADRRTVLAEYADGRLTIH